MIKKESMVNYCTIIKARYNSISNVFFNLNEYGKVDKVNVKITFNGILHNPKPQLWTSKGPSSIITELYNIASDKNTNTYYKIITIFGAESNDKGVTIHYASIGLPKNG